MGGMGWKGRDRDVRQRLIALVRQTFHMKYENTRYGRQTFHKKYENTVYGRQNFHMKLHALANLPYEIRKYGNTKILGIGVRQRLIALVSFDSFAFLR